jgi:DNA polymerase-3 subunit delta
LQKWVKERAVKHGRNLSDAVISAIIEIVGPNLWVLNNELEKLFIYAGEKEIDLKLVENIVTPNPQSTVFKLTDYLGEKKLRSALQTLEILIESGEEMMGVLFMLVRHFRVMVQVQELLGEGLRAPEIAAKIKEHPFVVSKMVGQSRNFSRAEIGAIYARLAEIDQGVKTGRIRLATGDTSELEQAMEMMMIELCS